jgi:hypothetical protein
LCCVVLCSWLCLFRRYELCCVAGFRFFVVLLFFVFRKMKLVEVRSRSGLLLISNLVFPDLRSGSIMF